MRRWEWGKTDERQKINHSSVVADTSTHFEHEVTGHEHVDICLAIFNSDEQNSFYRFTTFWLRNYRYETNLKRVIIPMRYWLLLSDESINKIFVEVAVISALWNYDHLIFTDLYRQNLNATLCFSFFICQPAPITQLSQLFIHIN